MKMLKLGGQDLKVSNFIFGTAKLHKVYSPKDRIKLLSAAVENGFTHFDTSPLYGFGIAESDLGRIMQRYAQTTVTTKFGLYGPGRSEKSHFEIYSRKFLGRKISSLSRARSDFDVRVARESLYRSLRRLKKDTIELFMLHEPPVFSSKRTDILEFLLESKEKGLIRNFGISGNILSLNQFLSPGLNFLEVAQTQESDELELIRKLGTKMELGLIRYGFSVSTDGTERDYFKKLKSGLTGNPESPIIVSTNRLSRIHQYEKLLREL